MGRVDELMNLSGRYGSDPDPSPTSTAAPGIGAQLLDLTAATPVKPCTPPPEAASLVRVLEPPLRVTAVYENPSESSAYLAGQCGGALFPPRRTVGSAPVFHRQATRVRLIPNPPIHTGGRREDSGRV